ncbi:zinc finger MYM-type protein 1-like [Gordionus sp. m RMFG-2023]|uniref:zinc finger MYM-type protein 1-like n=1 Tax=Gordionus sp. m RMFG-2023 TaxID=3053472 RepID=UPI0031FC47A9
MASVQSLPLSSHLSEATTSIMPSDISQSKQNLPYRGSNATETLSLFDNENLNHGNFLEMIRIISKNDQILRDHLEKAILKSKRRKDTLKLSNKSKSKGRGSLITLLSKTTVNKVIDAVLDQIRNLIKKEIGNKRFSLQMDSTQDICVYDQATICLRYIYNGKITERLFTLTKVTNSSGKGFFDILSECFLKHGIQMRNIIGESFDGAANMRGEFVGLQALIRQEAPGSLYIWCYSHILNLYICDSCDNIEGKILFGLLNRLATFFGESYKRMDAWVKQNNSTGQNKLRRLQKIGETRWWAREKSLKWIYGKESLLLITISALRNTSILASDNVPTISRELNLILTPLQITSHVLTSVNDCSTGGDSVINKRKRWQINQKKKRTRDSEDLQNRTFSYLSTYGEYLCTDCSTKNSNRTSKYIVMKARINVLKNRLTFIGLKYFVL